MLMRHCTDALMRRGAVRAAPYLVARSMSSKLHPANQNIVEFMDGNKRWIESGCAAVPYDGALVDNLIEDPFNPVTKKALVISCARSVAPMDSMFNTKPGELQVVRTCGNMCTSNDGVLGSVEYALGSAQAPPLLMVLGNSKNAVVTDAVRKAMIEAGRSADLPETKSSWLRFSSSTEGTDNALVDEMLPIAKDAVVSEPQASFERLCDVAGKLNVWRTCESLLTLSPTVHQAVKEGTLQVQGAYFDVASGKVSMMGQHPSLSKLLMVTPAEELVRTASAPYVPAEEAYALMAAGNARYASGFGGMMKTDDDNLLLQLSEGGQCPMSIVLGCSDSRAPVETIFDMKPGDLFILRNAGNTVAAAKGSVIGSAEYSVANLRTKNIIVLGHHKCGAITAAVQTIHAAGTKLEDGTFDLSTIDLETVPGSIGDVLRDILEASALAINEIPHASMAEQITLGVHRNVTYTIEKVIQFSPIIRDGILKGEINIYGGVYDIISGKVEWTGQHAELERILGKPMPFWKWKNTPYFSPPVAPAPKSAAATEAMAQLTEGNTRFINNTPAKVSTSFMSSSTANDISDTAPSAIVVGGAEISIPIEKIFDTTPGSLIVQRSMSNIAGRPGGTLFNSLEYAVQKWSPKLLVVMGESHSTVMADAFAQIAGDEPPSQAKSAILARVLVSALRAEQQVSKMDSLSSAARDDLTRKLSVELNALYTIEQLLLSPIIKKAVEQDGLELHAAVLDATSGKVNFVGEHPMQAELLKD